MTEVTQMANEAQAPAAPITDSVDRWLARRAAGAQLDAAKISPPARSLRATYSKAQRVRRAPPNKPEASPRRTPFCANPKEGRASINRANSQHSTGPRSAAGKQHSSLNAVAHGLTSHSPVLATEDAAAYQRHCRQFLDEYQPATPTESQLTQEIADTAWRLNRIPHLEAALLDRAANPPSDQARIEFDIVDAHRALATLGLHGQRLSRQFQKAMEQLREIQSERRQEQERELKRAAVLLELHKHKGIPYHPAEFGFVFSKDQIEAHAQRLMRLNESRHIEHVLFHMQPPIKREAACAAGARWTPSRSSPSPASI